jgi:hypothetical protein
VAPPARKHTTAHRVARGMTARGWPVQAVRARRREKGPTPF